ncbi:MAG: hypothetical protein R2795_11600 [Saprospiraceae bacterium]
MKHHYLQFELIAFPDHDPARFPVEGEGKAGILLLCGKEDVSIENKDFWKRCLRP